MDIPFYVGKLCVCVLVHMYTLVLHVFCVRLYTFVVHVLSCTFMLIGIHAHISVTRVCVQVCESLVSPSTELSRVSVSAPFALSLHLG